MLLEEIVKIVGGLPSGYDALVFVAGIIVMLYLLDCFYGVIRILCNHFLR